MNEKNKEHYKKMFENHVATFTDYGNIKILDFQKPGSVEYRIRFLFEEDFYRLHISGDLGELIANNYHNMRYEEFEKDFVRDTGYFEQKVLCHNRPFYVYDYDKAKKELAKHLSDGDLDDDYEIDELEDIVEEIMSDFEETTGFGSKAYSIAMEYDRNSYAWLSDCGKEETDILELYMLAFSLAKERLVK